MKTLNEEQQYNTKSDSESMQSDAKIRMEGLLDSLLRRKVYVPQDAQLRNTGHATQDAQLRNNGDCCQQQKTFNFRIYF